MKILFIAPLTRKINTQTTAARPRLIFDLVSGLIRRGHRVTVLGTEDSNIPGAKIIPVTKKGFYEISSSFENPFYAHTSFLARQAKMAEKLSSNFDIMHNHCYPEFISLLSVKSFNCPVITTLHQAISPETDETLSMFPETYIVCAAKSIKKKAKKTKIFKIIYHGVDTNLYKFCNKKENYLLWVGRLSKAKDKNGNFIDPKGVRWAIKLAKETNSELKLVANVEDIDFFNKDVRPHLSEKIKWVGPVSFDQPLSKKEISSLMQKAKALLMMTQLDEGFGLVAAEAQSCGTPIIAFDREPISEIITNGRTGFVVKKSEGISGLKNALARIERIKPEDCRKNAERNFSLEKMVSEYEKLYLEILKIKK